MERSFRVAQQVGETEFDLKNRIARARVPEGEVDLTDVHVWKPSIIYCFQNLLLC